MDCGAPTRTRTADLLITNQLLYQLSYRGTSASLNKHCEISKIKNKFLLSLSFYSSLFALARRTTAQSPTKEIYIAAGAAFTKSSRLACSCTRVDKVLKLNGLNNKVAGNSFTQSTNTKSIADPSEPFIIGK